MPKYAGFFDAITGLLCMITRTKKAPPQELSTDTCQLYPEMALFTSPQIIMIFF